MEHLQRVWHASRERLPFRKPGFVPQLGDLLVIQLLRLDSSNLPCLTRLLPRTPLGTFLILLPCLIYTLLLCRRHSWRVRLAKQETLTPPGQLVSPLVCRGPWMSTVVLYCWCHSDSASVLLYFTLLTHLFPLPCGACSTVPREGFDSLLLFLFPGVLWLWHFLYNVGPHRVSSLHIYTFVVSRAFMAGAVSQAGDANSSRAPCLTCGLQVPMNVHRGALLLVPQWQCISSFVFYILKNFYDVTYCVLSMDRWTNQPVAVDS